MKKYQLSERGVEGAFPIEWNRLPSSVFNKISSDRIVELLCYSVETGRLSRSSVVYFKEVTEFTEKIIQTIVEDQIIYGV